MRVTPDRTGKGSEVERQDQGSPRPDCQHASTCALPASSLASSSPSVCPAQQARGLFSSTRGLQDRAAQAMVAPALSPGRGSTHVDLLYFKDPSLVLTRCIFFPSYPVKRRLFLQLWLYRNSARFQLVSNENCSTCRCMFDVFVGRIELHILLLCHLDLHS